MVPFPTAGVLGVSSDSTDATEVSSGVMGYALGENDIAVYGAALGTNSKAGYFAGPLLAGRVGVGLFGNAAVTGPESLLLVNNGVDDDGSIYDGAGFYASTTGSAVYAEQQGTTATAYAGYFSGRVAAVGRDAQERVLEARCQGDATRCLVVNGSRSSGGYVWQQFEHLGTEKWWFRTDTANFAFGLAARTGGPSPAPYTTTDVLRITQDGNVGIAGATLPNPKLLVNKGVADAGNPNNAVDILANVTDTGLYVENPAPATPVVGTDQWAAYFSGDTNVFGRICLNDDGSRANCISAWPAGGGGGGSGQWTLNSGANLIFPNDSSRRVAIGGTTDAAPFFYDPGANVLSLDRGNLALQGGALYLKNPPSRGGRPPSEGGAADRVTPGERLADLLKPRAALAGSVTNPLGPPPVRLFVRDGVVSIEERASGNKLELGNAGRDIASNSDLYLRPQSVAGGSNAARLTLRNSLTQLELPYLQLSNPDPNTPLSISHTGGATSLSVSNTSAALGSPTVLITNISTSGSGHGLRAILSGASNGSSSLYGDNPSTAGWAGYFEGRVNITSSLCFGGSGGSGGTDCRTDWPTLANLGGVGGRGSGWANYVPKWIDANTLGNSQIIDNATTVGINYTPGASQARLVVNQSGATGGSSGDAIAAFADSTNSAVYAKQANNGGWAGYFSGRLGVFGGLTALGPTNSEGSGLRVGFAQWSFFEGEGWDTVTPVGGSCTITAPVGDATASNGSYERITTCLSGTTYTTTVNAGLPPGNYTMSVRLRTTHNHSTAYQIQYGVQLPSGFQSRSISVVDFPLVDQWKVFTMDFTLGNETVFPRFQFAMSLPSIDIDTISFSPISREQQTASIDSGCYRTSFTGTAADTNLVGLQGPVLSKCADEDGCEVELVWGLGANVDDTDAISTGKLYVSSAGSRFTHTGVDNTTPNLATAFSYTGSVYNGCGGSPGTDIVMSARPGGTNYCRLNYYNGCIGSANWQLAHVAAGGTQFTCQVEICD
ncbi:MAG: hypothetical protein HYZ09_00420 [Candidatus Kerfeldbacteria bacterium]|nr:hypothetical protein [Candidatus Kerfeldbacteria bacterium]